MSQEPEKFRNYYRCPNDGTEWQDKWSCMCNDRCPSCNAEIESYTSEELCLQCGAVVDNASDGRCPECNKPIESFDEVQERVLVDVGADSGAGSGVGSDETNPIELHPPVDRPEHFIILVTHPRDHANHAYEYETRSAAQTFFQEACENSRAHVRMFHAALTAERKQA